MKKKLLISLLICGVSSSLLSAPPLTKVADESQLNLAPVMEYVEDPERSFFIDDIASERMEEQFRPVDKEVVNFGFTPSAYWFRFTLRPDRDSIRYLLLENSLTDEIDLFIPKNNQSGYEQRTTGDHHPFETRDINTRDFIFKLNLKKDEEQTYYLRVTNGGSFFFFLNLVTQQFYEERKDVETFIFGTYYGTMLVIFAISCLVWFSFKEQSYLYFSIYIIIFTLFQLTADGFAFQYLWPDWPEFGKKNSVLLVHLNSIALVVFVRSFLNYRVVAPRVDMVLIVAIAISLLGVPMTFLFPQVSTRMAVVANFLAPVTIILSCIYLMIRNNHLAKYFILANIVFLLGMLGRVFLYAGTIGFHPVLYYSLHIGSVLELTILSAALVKRITAIRNENEHNQRMMIVHQKEALEAQAKLNRAYARFVPRQFLDFLNKDSIEDVQLGDSVEREMTVLFLDIRSFTSISENMKPHENFRFLNAIYKRISPVIRKHHGFIDKYIGDAVMALFPGRPVDAIRASIDMQVMIQRLNKIRARMSFEPISVGIGLHVGNLMLGTIGESERMEGTVISDAVNLASRIEGLTKRYRVGTLITEEVYNSIENPDEFGIRKIDRIQVKGKEQFVTIYEVYDADAGELKENKKKTKSIFQAGIDYFLSGNREEAIEKFSESIKVCPDDMTAKVMRVLAKRL